MKETKIKDTEIGKIPEEWSICNFGDIFTFFSNNTLSRDMLGERGDMHNVHYGDVLIKYGSTLDVEKESIPSIREEYCYKSTNKIEDGDVIIADTAEDETVGKACEILNVGSKYIVSGLHTIWVRPKGNLFAAKYLGYAMNGTTYHNQLLPLIQGTKVSSISKAAIKDTCIIVPPIDEQHRIASALTSIDNLISSLGKLIEKKKNIKQETMQQLLTGQIHLKGFSEPWVNYTIDELFDLGNGYTPSKSNPAYWTNGTIPWFRMEDIRTNGRILKDSIQHITPEAVKGSGLYPKYSIILSTTATIGEHALLIADSLANQRFTFLNRKVNRKNMIDIMFFYHYCFILGKWCRDNINAGGLLAVNMEDLKNHSIYMPQSIAEQRAIATILTKMDNEITALEAKRAKYEAIKQGMMQQLLTGKIRLIG